MQWDSMGLYHSLDSASTHGIHGLSIALLANRFWLVVSAPLKNIGQLGWLSPLYQKNETCSKPPISYSDFKFYLHNLDKAMRCQVETTTRQLSQSGNFAKSWAFWFPFGLRTKQGQGRRRQPLASPANLLASRLAKFAELCVVKQLRSSCKVWMLCVEICWIQYPCLHECLWPWNKHTSGKMIDFQSVDCLGVAILGQANPTVV